MRAMSTRVHTWFLGAIVATSLATTASASLPPVCGLSEAPPPAWEHVVWIWFENHGLGAILGSPQARFFNRTLIPRCGLATNYHGLTHPSLPNYIAATSGLPLNALGALRDNCDATGPCRTRATSIFEQVPSWAAYQESMTRPCAHWGAGVYAAKHNPAVYYQTLPDCRGHDLPLRALGPALATDTLPAFVFITPNLCHSMHDCSVGVGDRWLARMVKRLTASAAYRRGTTAIFVTFDESDSDDPDDRVVTVVISPSTVPGTRSGRWFSHYSLLRTTEEMLGVPALREARRAASMRAAFNL
jgi:hypothetical protein